MVAGITGLVFIIINLNSVFVDKDVFVRTAVWGAEKSHSGKSKRGGFKAFFVAFAVFIAACAAAEDVRSRRAVASIIFILRSAGNRLFF